MVKTQLISAEPDSKAMVASGGDIDTVSESQRLNALIPNALAAAACNVTACAETFTAGSAIFLQRSISSNDRIAGSLVLMA
jgi:hypothetical protein